MAASVLALLASVAWADQCAVMSRKQADAAKSVIAEAGQFAQFCGPCEDSESVVAKVSSVEVRAFAGSASLYELVVNGAGIDAAYTYVPTAEGKWMNLANTIECPAEDVSATIPRPVGATTAPATPPPPPAPKHTPVPPAE